jgi:two-component system sensor histidine kinase FlrB
MSPLARTDDTVPVVEDQPAPPSVGLSGDALTALRTEQASLRGLLNESAERLAGSLRERTALAARLAIILDSLPCAVVVVDSGGRVMQSSTQAVGLTSAAVGDAWSSVTTRLTPTAVADEFFLGARCLRIQHSATPSGETVWSLTDVTAAAAARAGLERERQLVALGQFAAHLAHQVRTPLAAALLHAGVLARSTIDDAQRQQLQALTDRLQHMQAYISHAFDQLGDHGSAPPAKIALGTFLHGVKTAMAGLAARRQVDLHLHLTEDCGQITAWRVPLEGALINLLDNAIQFSPAGGTVELRVEAGPDRVLLRVVDQGPGIDPNLLPRIFEPFVSGRDGGTGLGLSIARGVVERHGGTLTADSAPGCGATFSIDLPRGPLGGAR